MGLFSSKKRTYVSSSVWNMAGDIADRANYLKSLVVGNIITQSPEPLGQTIPRSYLNGPGMGFRRYANWARGSSNYDDNVGYVGGGISIGNSIDLAVVRDEIPHGPNEFVSLNESDLGIADYTWWAEEYMVNNHPDLIFTDWYSDIAEGTNDITITFEDTTTVTFSPVGYDPEKFYLYALYQTISGGVVGPITPGSIITVPTEGDFPAVPVDYTLYSDVDTVVPVTLDVHTVVDVTYSDATPPEHTETPTTIDTDYTVNEKTYHKYTLVDTSTSTRDLYIQTRGWEVVAGTPVVTVENEDIGGGVIKTTTTTVTTEELSPVYSYHNDVQDAANNTVSPFMYFRYEKDTGNTALDAMFDAPTDIGAFLPYIPIRINNAFLRDTDPGLYTQTRKAYKKAMAGADLDKLITKIEDNDQLGDLDFVYAVYGTSLNSPENTAKEYMFRFFTAMADANPTSGTQFQDWRTQFAAADDSMDAYIEWANTGGSGVSEPPPIIPYPTLPVMQINTKSTTSHMNFHLQFSLNGIVQDSGSDGFIIGDHKKGDYWFVVRDTVEYVKRYTTSGGMSGSGYRTETIEVEQISLYFMDTDSHYQSLDMFGLTHTNYVYDNKTVIITGKEAFLDPEESGFIIPLHEATFRQMSLVDQTQLATACCYLMFNCYQVVKSKWYQSGFFKLLLVVVVVVVSVLFPPAGGAGAAGVLGSAGAVGGALGFTGTAALVAGTIANALAAMIIAKALTTAFGGTVGSLLATAITVGLTVSGGIMGGTGSFDSGAMISELSKAENLLAITDGLVKSIQSYMTDKTQAILAETQELMTKYKADMLEVQKQYDEMFGGSTGIIDPTLFTDSSLRFDGENRGTYIERTLMCGSEIAQMSHDLVTNFAEITLSTELLS